MITAVVPLLSKEVNLVQRTDKTDIAAIATRIDKMLVPALLLFLAQKSSHGYELIQKVNESGFSEADADPATVYRNLRKMEEEGLVISQWETTPTGPARRSYQLSDKGCQALKICVQLLAEKKEKIEAFLADYKSWIKGE